VKKKKREKNAWQFIGGKKRKKKGEGKIFAPNRGFEGKGKNGKPLFAADIA